jgi:transcriptional regulator with XRE-family HTH domain
MSSTIKEARVRAGLTGAEVATAVGRSAEWLGFVECGATPLKPEHERVILEAVNRLRRFHVTVAEAKEKLTRDLKLPPARSASHAQ